MDVVSRVPSVTVTVESYTWAAGSVGVVAYEASKLIKRVFASLISSLLPVVLFPLLNTELPVCLQLLRLIATASQLGGLMSQAFISRFRTSSFRRCGLPGGLEPVASSHQRMSFGIWPSFIRLTWPIHLRVLWLSMAKMLGIPACATTSLLETTSSDACFSSKTVLIYSVESTFLSRVHGPSITAVWECAKYTSPI